MNEIKQSIFREYDIRAIAETELQADVVERITAAFATVFLRNNCKEIVIGMDGRPSSPAMRDTVRNTLTRYGLNVIDIGLVPSPLLYFEVFRNHRDAGMMITASHNPGEYNGIKSMMGHNSIFGEDLQEIYKIAEKGDFPAETAPGTVTEINIIPEYLEYITGNVKLEKSLKVVVDAGNGTGGITAGDLYRAIGAEVTEIFCDVDGTFPNHHPDPTKEKNLQDLIAKVKETGSDLGIGFDGDADRIGVVDSEGNILWGDQLTLIFAKDILQKDPGATIISEVKASEVLYSEIAKHGGRPIMWKTGHSIIKKKIVEEKAALAGEMSGHIFFCDKWYGFDDAVYAGARLLEIISNTGKSLNEHLKEIPVAFNTPELRVDTTEEAKFKIVDEIRDHFSKDYDVIDIDGARIKFPGGWALVRASNTQPSLVVRFEADSEERLGELRTIVEPVIEASRKRCE